MMFTICSNELMLPQPSSAKYVRARLPGFMQFPLWRDCSNRTSTTPEQSLVLTTISLMSSQEMLATSGVPAKSGPMVSWTVMV